MKTLSRCRLGNEVRGMSPFVRVPWRRGRSAIASHREMTSCTFLGALATGIAVIVAAALASTIGHASDAISGGLLRQMPTTVIDEYFLEVPPPRPLQGFQAYDGEWQVREGELTAAPAAGTSRPRFPSPA